MNEETSKIDTDMQVRVKISRCIDKHRYNWEDMQIGEEMYIDSEICDERLNEDVPNWHWSLKSIKRYNLDQYMQIRSRDVRFQIQDRWRPTRLRKRETGLMKTCWDAWFMKWWRHGFFINK
jgi:hypothetical protein